MMRRLACFALVALVLAAPALLAQPASAPSPGKSPIRAKPWPADEVLLAREADSQNRKLFQSESILDFVLTSDLSLINADRTPGSAKQFPGVLAAAGVELPVTLGSRGHLRLTARTCDFVPIRIAFPHDQVAGTVFEGQTTVKLGTHCRSDQAFDQYVIREYLAYKLTNLVTPLSFRARLARGAYVDARSNKRQSTHLALFLEHENDVARRLSGRQVRLPHLVFNQLDGEALTRMMLLEYMLGNTDYSIWALHNVVIVQDKRRRFFPVPYDFDLSGMVHAPYAAPDPRLPLHSVTDRLYRGPCRSVGEFDAAAEPFRARQTDMMAAIDSVGELDRVHKSEMKDYLASFFRRIATPEAIKKAFVDGCPASRARI